MQRKLPSDQAENFEHLDDNDLAEIRRQLARFAADNIAGLTGCFPVMPDGFANRLAANWRLLLAIADLCGKGIADAARKSAAALSKRSDEASLGVELLRDIRDIFAARKIDRIRSEELTNKLANMSDRLWSELPWTGKPITQLQLAKMLKDYKIKPKKIRFELGPFNGYELDWFEKAWRYIPPDTPENAGISEQSQDSAKKAGTCSEQKSKNVPGEMAENRQCSAVPGILPLEACAACSGLGCPWCSLKSTACLGERNERLVAPQHQEGPASACLS
jgi:hypothetical protein